MPVCWRRCRQSQGRVAVEDLSPAGRGSILSPNCHAAMATATPGAKSLKHSRQTFANLVLFPHYMSLEKSYISLQLQSKVDRARMYKHI